MDGNEFFEEIIKFAQNEEEIRAVWLNGSRANENAPKDCLQDFDVVFVCENIDRYIQNRDWLERFGKAALSQEGVMAQENAQTQSYLIMTQFDDLNRMDAAFVCIEFAEKSIHADSLTKLILDKDGRFSLLEDSSEKNYRVKIPTYEEFKDCCNEFWWVFVYVAKGIRRNELLYAHEHLCILREEALKLLSWKIAAANPLAVAGKCNKYIARYLSEKEYRQLLSCYVSIKPQEMRAALWKIGVLFSDAAQDVAKAYDFFYYAQEEEGAKRIAKQILELPDITR